MKFFPVIFSIAIISGCNNSVSKESHIPGPVAADSGSTKLFPVKDLHDDLHLLWSAIQEIHPGYGFYTSTDSLKKICERTDASIQSPLSESQFMELVYPFLCQLRCGHTQLKHSATYQRPNENPPHLPFHVLVRHHKAWITTHETSQMNTGDEIVSINGIPAAAIIDHGYDLYCGDGYNETFKELFLSEYVGFEDVCNKYYHWTGPYRMELHVTGGVTRHIIANPAEKADFASVASQKKVDNFSGWTVSPAIPDDRLHFLKGAPIAMLKIPPFAYTDTDWYKVAFKTIREKGIKNLILDMRHNSGGDIRVATKLLSYLADSSFNIIGDVRTRLPDPSLSRYATYFDTSVTNNFKLGYKPGHQENGWYHIDATPAFGHLYGPFPLAD